ncbi:NAD(P)-dependent oxidoreductase [Lentisphaerota bacterium WC36G]|nr:phosphoglycerate dehydrogenase [Lentisphaerae bacterium WC36]
MKKKVAFFNNDAKINLPKVFGDKGVAKIHELCDVYDEVVSNDNFAEHIDKIQDVEVIFSTWGMPVFAQEEADRLPNLKLILYAAGATRDFRFPFVNNGVTVCSATAANAIPVAEYCVSQIVLAATGFFKNIIDCRDSRKMHSHTAHIGRGCYGARVALLGNGTISQLVHGMLEKDYCLDVVVIPSRPEQRTMSLEEAFATSYVVSNHFPDRDDNVHVFNKELFESIPENGTFINTGRGRQVNEDDLIEVCKKRQDLIALLDVQHPEPPVEGSELYSLDNIYLTSHIAGSKNDETCRMADYMIEEFIRWENGEELKYVVAPDQL